MYCNRTCVGMARRVERTDDEKKALKAEYDKERREKLGEQIRAEKREHYHANRDQILAVQAVYRKKRMPAHVEYCRQPKYRVYKSEYDLQRRASEYGELAEVYLLLLDLDKEIRSQATAYERRVANGYYTRNAQKRRRELWKQRKNSMPAI